MAMQINFQEQVVSASVGNDELEVAHSFCYLGDVTYIRCARKTFYELIPESCHTSLSFKHRGHTYDNDTCIRKYYCMTMKHGQAK